MMEICIHTFWLYEVENLGFQIPPRVVMVVMLYNKSTVRKKKKQIVYLSCSRSILPSDPQSFHLCSHTIIYSSIRLSKNPSILLSIYPSVQSSIFPCIHPSMQSSILPPIHPYNHLLIQLSIYTYVHKCSVDPWTKWVSTLWIHLYADYFQ